MEFEIACACGQHMLVEGRYVGQEVECPACKGLLPVPDPPRSGDPAPVVSPLPSTVVGPPQSPPPVPPPPPSVRLDYRGVQVVERRTHGRAVAALVCAILGMVACPVVPSIIALVLAAQAKQEIRAQPDVYTGMGIATAAQICAVVGLLGICLLLGCPTFVIP